MAEKQERDDRTPAQVVADKKLKEAAEAAEGSTSKKS